MENDLVCIVTLLALSNCLEMQTGPCGLLHSFFSGDGTFPDSNCLKRLAVRKDWLRCNSC